MGLPGHENCDFTVSRSPRWQDQLTNASAAAAVLLYEAVRQRTAAEQHYVLYFLSKTFYLTGISGHESTILREPIRTTVTTKPRTER